MLLLRLLTLIGLKIGRDVEKGVVRYELSPKRSESKRVPLVMLKEVSSNLVKVVLSLITAAKQAIPASLS